MTNTNESGSQRSMEELIASLAQIEPPFSSLGTPFFVDTEQTREIVHHGVAAVPALQAALGSADPTIVMYAAYCLGLIGERSALPSLLNTRTHYQTREPKQENDFAVISAVKQAEDRLRS
jgi:HEAT repeat protein